MNGKSKAWAVALLLGVLFLGGAAGAAVDRLILTRAKSAAEESRRGGDRGRRDYVGWLAAELTLSDTQRAQIEVLVEEHREQVSALWKEMRPRFEDYQSQLRGEIREVLTPEQLAAYEALLAKEQERHRSRRSRR
jgi:Spy/CpxP family protein refolding chaperone